MFIKVDEINGNIFLHVESKGYVPKVHDFLCGKKSVVITMTCNFADDSGSIEKNVYCENRDIAAKFLNNLRKDIRSGEYNFLITDDYVNFIDVTFGEFVNVFVWDKATEDMKLFTIENGHIPF